MQPPGQEVYKPQTGIIWKNIYRKYHSITPGSFSKHPQATVRETGLWTRCTSGLIQYGHSFILMQKLEESFFISPVERKYAQGVVSQSVPGAVLLKQAQTLFRK